MFLSVKICGIRTEEAVQAAAEGGAELVGMVFYPPSPRHLTLPQAAELKRRIPSSLRTVAVCVSPEDDLLEELAHHIAPDYIQLHGTETPKRTQEIRSRYGIPVIKALGIRTAEDLNAATDFATSADLLLFDAKTTDPNLPGGAGLTFDWTLLQERDFPLPWFLSGGISADNLADAVRLSGATMIDASSSLESSRGIKDPARILDFLDRAQSIAS